VYRHTEILGGRVQKGLEDIFATVNIPAVVARQGSAFCWYFMDHLPKDWHDLASNHNFALDTAFRAQLVDRGIYVFPLPPKQCSISAAHTIEDIDETLEQVKHAIRDAVETSADHSAAVVGRG
jgi:glutamate-1-semialdehyde 2,1-aminomutase